jgi:hypothetical protein
MRTRDKVLATIDTIFDVLGTFEEVMTFDGDDDLDVTYLRLLSHGKRCVADLRELDGGQA